MRYLSRIFQPVITIPKNAKLKNTEITCKSQKLLLECGLIRPTSAGLFAILPLARRALDKLETQIRLCIEEAGVQRMSLPCLTAASLWEKTGRLQAVGPELMKTEDRHSKKYLLAPTHEEALADLFADVGPLSYKQLPLLLYQITNKYRDEHRPKHGLLRAREFSMLDAYGAHHSMEDALQVYQTLTDAYQRLFRRLQLPVYQVSAPPGDMGGTVSDEWQLPAAAGEDRLAVCGSCQRATLDPRDTCDQCGQALTCNNSIEVGHTFILGTKYSEPLGAHVTPPRGPAEPIIMSCYGIGITRLLAASLEALSSDKSLRWPKIIAPYSVCVIGPKEGSREWQSLGWEGVCRLHDALSLSLPAQYGDDVVVDDRHQLTIGKRLMMADRVGYPYTVVCGRRALESPPRYELYTARCDSDTTVLLLTLEELITFICNEGNDELKIKTNV